MNHGPWSHSVPFVCPPGKLVSTYIRYFASMSVNQAVVMFVRQSVSPSVHHLFFFCVDNYLAPEISENVKMSIRKCVFAPAVIMFASIHAILRQLIMGDERVAI